MALLQDWIRTKGKVEIQKMWRLRHKRIPIFLILLWRSAPVSGCSPNFVLMIKNDDLEWLDRQDWRWNFGIFANMGMPLRLTFEGKDYWFQIENERLITKGTVEIPIVFEGASLTLLRNGKSWLIEGNGTGLSSDLVHAIGRAIESRCRLWKKEPSSSSHLFLFVFDFGHFFPNIWSKRLDLL